MIIIKGCSIKGILFVYLSNKRIISHLMNKIITLSIFLFTLNTLSCLNAMKKDEIKLINTGDYESPYRVLTTENKEDSIFLRQKCEDIDIRNINEDKDLHTFIYRLKKTMIAELGVGIAAPQVGIGRNIFLFSRIDKSGSPIEVVINPKIVAHSEKTICFERDGCLSIPGISGNSLRYEWIEVEYYDETGKLHKERLSGNSRKSDYTGIIFQHEYDHLQGILFIDKLCQ